METSATSSQPIVVSEPIGKRRPKKVSGPNHKRKPELKSGPKSSRQPKSVSEPVIQESPITPNEPDSLRQPSGVSGPPAPSNPRAKSDRARRCLRQAVRGCYDVQQLRIQMGLRLVASWKNKLGIEPGQKENVEVDEDAEPQMDAKGKEILKRLRAEQQRLSSAVANRIVKELPQDGEGLIDSLTEYALVTNYLDLEKSEAAQFRMLEYPLREFQLWNEYLKPHVLGCGPAMAGVILSEFDIHKAKYPSSLWKYASLDVAPDGRGRGRYAEHLRDIEYIDKNGKPAVRKGLTGNPFIKTKLVGVLAGCFIKQKESPYRKIYLDYKHRIECDPRHAEKTKMHRHNMAKRYCIKMFLIDLYKVWRAMEGLPVAPPYSEAKLGMKHGQQLS